MEELDQDIQGMKRKDLVGELKALKAKGVKVAVSGNVGELRSRLHSARRQLAPGAATTGDNAGGPTALSTAIDPPAPTANLARVLVEHENIHPITQSCLEKLGRAQYQVSEVSTPF